VASFVAVYDACVLHPAALRDLLLHLALMRLFRARWTDRIHDEWIQSLIRHAWRVPAPGWTRRFLTHWSPVTTG